MLVAKQIQVNARTEQQMGCFKNVHATKFEKYNNS